MNCSALSIRQCCRYCLLFCAATFSVLLIGCAYEEQIAVSPEATIVPIFAESSETEMITIEANRQWTRTHWEIQRGDVISLVARGNVVVPVLKPSTMKERLSHNKRKATYVGPNGTFLYEDNVAYQSFPIPSAASGPAPAYCLIGHIGGGKPFYVGSRKSWVAQESGTLYLGINDFCPANNQGQFQVQISKPNMLQPLQYEEAIPDNDPLGMPRDCCSVVIFYIDGLRPDVVREMAYMGHIPTINKMFVAGGTWASNVFTGFPSDTITSNGTMWTGCFSDRHGIKGQVRFSRRTLHSESYLEPLGPNRSARLLAPQGVDKFKHESTVAAIKLTQGEEVGNKYDHRNRTGIPPLFQHLRNNGEDWATGVLPMMTEIPPLLWTRSIVKEMPYFDSQNAWQYIDDANTHYTIRRLLRKRKPVTIVWLPETDSVSHKKNRGQFGVTRRTIAQADLHIKRIVDELKAMQQFHKTYFLLVSDHGHHGGRMTHLSHFDIANELFYKPREIAEDGTWVGGGFGMTVRQHRFRNHHPGHRSTEFVFIDGDSDGVARIYLPKEHFKSRHWMGKPRPADLLAYKINKDRPAINLINSITATKAVHGSGKWRRPVDLVIVKLTDNSILISTEDRGKAVIDRHRNHLQQWVYRYRVVTNLQPLNDGSISYTVIKNPQKDPLRLLEHWATELMGQYFKERDWLRITANTTYPDSVVAITRHMLWQENLKHREEEFAPDLVVTAHPGWYFGHQGSRGTMHGYPLADAMRASLFISGPNIRRGARMDTPCRLADLTPTILQMTRTPYNPNDFDGQSLRLIYQNELENVMPVAQAVYWKDVDLQAWHPLCYTELSPYEHLPHSINKPDSAFDINNIVYNIATIPKWNVLGLFDDVVAPLTGNRLPKVAKLAENADQKARTHWHRWMGDAVDTIDLPSTTLGDYSWSSLGNLKRADRAIDWVQNREQDSNKMIAHKIGRQRIPGTRHANSGVDHVQDSIWDVYRYAQRVVIQVLDEIILNGIENHTDRGINAFDQLPAEIPAP